MKQFIHFKWAGLSFSIERMQISCLKPGRLTTPTQNSARMGIINDGLDEFCNCLLNDAPNTRRIGRSILSRQRRDRQDDKLRVN